MDKINQDEALSDNDIAVILSHILEYARKKDLDMFKMGIVGAGEPLLSFDKIQKIVNYAEQNDAAEIFVFYTITNGTLVDKNMIDFFYAYKKRIALNFSLDGYEKLHNYGKAEFKKTVEGIKLYEKIFQEKPILNCTVSRQTLNNKEAVLDYFHEQGFEKVNFSQLIDVDAPDLDITHQDFVDFLRFVADTKVIKFRQNRTEKRYDCRIYGQLCGVGRTNIFITKQGIYPCCRLYKNNAYWLAVFDATLDEVELNMNVKVKPVKDGECYFNKHILGSI
jgi:uncharacterized protein